MYLLPDCHAMSQPHCNAFIIQFSFMIGITLKTLYSKKSAVLEYHTMQLQ